MKRLSLFFILSSTLANSQNVAFDRSNFPDRKDEFKDVLRKLDMGTEMYLAGRKDLDEWRKAYFLENKYLPVSIHDHEGSGTASFRSAYAPLSDAQRFNPQNADLNYMLGFIKLLTRRPPTEAVAHFSTSLQLDPAPQSDTKFWLGWALQLDHRWEEAIVHYEQHLAFLKQRSKTNAAAIEDVSKKIAECKTGLTLSANPQRVFVDNLGPGVNTGYPEYGPAITTDESTIFFTSRRPNSVGGKRDPSDNSHYEDVYSSARLTGKWQPARQLSKTVNSEGHDAVAGLSPDGSKLYIFRSTYEDRGDLYESVLFGADWETPARLNKNINTKYHESTISLSFDGKRLYFVSQKQGGYGSSDIYFSDMEPNGEWGPAKNLGSELNTRYGEDGVFMHPDGVTMYFSSKGHNSMGGYDIFKSTFANGKWQAPVNLGYPINGPDDDVFFVVSGSGNRAYFASNKAEGYGDYDLYKITFLGPDKQPLLNTEDQLIAAVAQPVPSLKVDAPVEVATAKVTILKGLVSDKESGNPLEAIIELTDNEKSVQIATFKSNSSSGRYLVTLPSGRNYGITVKAEGYLFHSENFDIAQAADFQEFAQNIQLQRVEVGNTIVLNNIFFDSEKSEIRPESTAELQRLVNLLKDNVTLKVEIGSHTDNQGSSDYNLALSNSRSKAVIDYLVAQGVAAERLVVKGYGEDQPLESNETETGRQSNRRTEFKILSK